MNAKKFSDAMSELDTKYVDEALNYKKKAKKPGWVKWGAMAACFAVIAVLGVGVFQSGLFGNKTDIATLDNGNEIIFVKSETAGSSIDIDGTITTRQTYGNGSCISFRKLDRYSSLQFFVLMILFPTATKN